MAERYILHAKTNSSHESEDSMKEIAIESSIASCIEPKRSKQEVICHDEESRKRGKRMLGMLLGTLDKFKKETESQSEADLKRQLVDQKLNEKRIQDKEEQARITEKERQERMERFELQRKEEQARMEKEMQEVIERNAELLGNFKKTQAKPQIYYRQAEKALPKE